MKGPVRYCGAPKGRLLGSQGVPLTSCLLALFPSGLGLRFNPPKMVKERYEPNRPHPLKTKLFKSSSSLAPLVSIALKRSVEPLVTQGVPILAPSASPPQTQHQLGLRLMVSLVHTTQGNLGWIHARRFTSGPLTSSVVMVSGSQSTLHCQIKSTALGCRAGTWEAVPVVLGTPSLDNYIVQNASKEV